MLIAIFHLEASFKCQLETLARNVRSGLVPPYRDSDMTRVIQMMLYELLAWKYDDSLDLKFVTMLGIYLFIVFEAQFSTCKLKFMEIVGFSWNHSDLKC